MPQEIAARAGSVFLREPLCGRWPSFESRGELTSDGCYRWVARETVWLTWCAFIFGSALGGMIIAWGTAYAYGVGSWSWFDTIYLAIFLLPCVLVGPMRTTLEMDPTTATLTLRRRRLWRSWSVAELDEVELGVHTVELRTYPTPLMSWSWCGYAVIAWFPDGERFVFACVREQARAVEYVSKLPISLIAAVEVDTEANPDVKARLSWLT